MSEFTLDCAQYVANELEINGYEGDVREAYSGRCMYGSTCVAIVTDAPATLIGKYVASYNREYENENLEEAEGPMRSDQMGLSMVYY